MSIREAYLFYEAGQAVAAAHLGLTIRQIGANPARGEQGVTEIVLPRNQPKVPIILWLTGMAAERKGAGQSDPLRRTRNSVRIRAHIQATVERSPGTPAQRSALAKHLRNQAQDRANAICATLFEAINTIADRLRATGLVAGAEVHDVVHAVKAKRSREGQPNPEEPAPEPSEDPSNPLPGTFEPPEQA